MSKFKRVISFLLTVVMLVGMMPNFGLISNAATDNVPGYGSLTRLVTFTINLNGGAYYFTQFTDYNGEDYSIDRDNIHIPDGTTGTIEVRMYHHDNGTKSEWYKDYLGVPYVNGNAMVDKAVRMDKLIINIINSLYKKDYSLEALDYDGVAFVTPGIMTKAFNKDVLFGKSTHTMPAVWRAYSEPASESKTVTLKAGPEGNNKTATIVLHHGDNEGFAYNESLPMSDAALRAIFGFAPKSKANDGRVFIGWAEGYNSTTHQGTGKMYMVGDGGNYEGESGATLYAIWGYPIMYDADGGVYSNGTDEYLTYVADYATWNGSNTSPTSQYKYVNPDNLSNAPVKEGARRYQDKNAYGLINADGTGFFTWEGDSENLTIPPKGGNANADGTWNSYEWDDFRCTRVDDSNNPYYIEFPEFVAIWEPSITYYPNGGTGSVKTDWLEWDGGRLYNYKDYDIRGESTFAKEGVTFEGWNTEIDGSGQWYEAGETLSEFSDSDPIKLYAQWSDDSYSGSEGTYKVILDPNGGTVSKGSSNGTMSGKQLVCTATPGQTYKEIIGSLPTPTRSGYIFEGWWYEQSDPYYDGPYLQNPGQGWFLDLNANYIIPKDVTFEAKWIANPSVKSPNSDKTYKMTFDPNGGTLVGPSVYYINNGNTYYSIFGDSEPVVYRKGYSLEGWFDTTYNYHLRTEYTTEKYAVTTNSTWKAKWIKINTHNCVWTTISSVAPTCTEAGSNYQGCFCGADRTVTVKAKGHTFDEYYGVRSNATCLDDRVDIYRCSACGDATEDRVATGTALGHEWGEWYYAQEIDNPTCEGTGTQTADCTRPGCDAKTTQVASPIGHDYDEGTFVPAYCNHADTYLYVCRNDPKHFYYEDVDGGNAALGHQFADPYDLGNGYTRIECHRAVTDGNEPCGHYVDTPNRYNIIYDLVLPTATFGANTPYYHTFGTDTTLVNPTATNATFKGWYLTPDYSGEPVTMIGAQEILAPRKYYAKWEITITLSISAAKNSYLYDPVTNTDLKKGTNQTYTMVYGVDTAIPYEWRHDSQTFTGWTNATLGTVGQYAVIPGTMFTANATLTAGYVANTFPIRYYDTSTGRYLTEADTYVTNIATVANDSMTYHDSDNKTMTFPTRTGYVATVYSDEACTTKYAAKPERNTTTRTNYPDEVIVLYLVWTANSKTLTLGENGGYFVVNATTKNGTDRTVTHTYDKDTILNKESSPSLNADFVDMYRQGYEFVGWNSGTTYNAGTRYSEDMFKIHANTVPMAAATTIYAEWKPNTFIVEYELWDMTTGEKIKITDDNAETLGVSNWDKMTIKSYTYGANSAAFTTLVRPGYTVTGWKYADGATLNGTNKNVIGSTAVYYDSAYHTHNAKVELREDGNYYIVLHAEATLKAEYKVQFGVNGGKFVLDGVEDTTTRSVMHSSDKDTILNTTDSPTLNKDFDTIYKIGYDFVGWNSGTAYNAGTRYSSEMHKLPKYSVAAAATIYAEWKPNTFTVEYYIDGVELTDDNYTFWGITDYAGSKYMPRTHTYGTASDNDDQLASAAYTISKWYYTPDFTGSTVANIGANAFSYDANGRDYVIKLYAYSTPNQYAHRMYPNGGTFTLTAGGTYSDYKNFTTTYNKVGDLKTLFTALDRPHYTFVGWNTVKDGTGDYVSYDKFSLPANTFTVADYFYAVWEPDTFPIEYYVDGVLLTEESAAEMGIVNYSSIVAKNIHKYGTATADLVRVQRTGYGTTKWSFTPGGTAISGDDIPATYCNYDDNGRDYVIKVYATSTPEDVRVVYRKDNSTDSIGAGNLATYFGLDGSAWPQVPYGETYVLPTSDIRNGYHLVGFYTEKSCTNRIYEIDTTRYVTTYNTGEDYAVTVDVWVKWEADETTPPTGTIDLGVGSAGISSAFIPVNEIRYGIYDQAYNNIVITGDKGNNYVAPTVEYFLSDKALTLTEVEALTDWTVAPNGEAFGLPEGTPDGEYILYVKITDDQNNVTYINSQRFVLDTTAPVFNTLVDGEYCFNDELGEGNYEFTVEERYLDKLTINGEAVALNLEKYSVAGSAEGTVYTVYAKDKVGNETTVTVKVYNCHDYVGEETKAPTCTVNGETTYTCTRCDDTYVEADIPAIGHDEIAHEAQAPTCTEIGWDAYVTCSRCDYTTYVELPALGHSYNEVITEPTCTEKGYTTYTCHCGDTYVDDEVEALGHTEVEIPAVAPTCDNTGLTAGVKCSVCGEILTEPEVVDALGHDWNEGVIDPTPGCTSEGVITFTCQRTECGKVYSVVLDASGHKPGETVVENAVAPTCTTDGSYDNVVYCTVCGGEISRTEVIVSAFGHTEGSVVVENVIAPTCENAGSYDNVVYCRTCNEELSRNTVTVEATGHIEGNTVAENHKAPTCTEKGSYDNVTRCAVCNKALKTETVEIEMIGHNYVSVTTEPTCTDEGYTTYTCTGCNDTYVSDYVDAKGHNEKTIGAVAPTCTETGLTEGKECTVCGVITVEQTVVDALGHTEGAVVYENVNGAGCTEPGSYDEVVYCTVCNTELSRKPVEVEALGHKYNAVVTAPTCTDKGYTTYTCTVCNDTYVSDYVDAKGHTKATKEENRVEATCKAPGSYDLVTYCSVCDTVINRETKTIAQLVHGEDYYVETEYVLMKDNGDGTYSDGMIIEIYKCSYCNEEVNRVETTLHPVAQNARTGKLYTAGDLRYIAFGEEMEAGDTVKLVDDAEIEDLLVQRAGYIDLNGHKLTVTTISVGNSTHIVDSSEADAGRLIVERSNQTINKSNCELPVWDATAGGYQFIGPVKMQQLDAKFSIDSTTGATNVSLTFRPIVGGSTAATKEIFADGGADNKLKIGVVFTVTKDGVTSNKMYWICADSLVQKVYQNGRAFEVTLTGLEAYDSISIGSVIISELGVEMTSNLNGTDNSTVITWNIPTANA